MTEEKTTKLPLGSEADNQYTVCLKEFAAEDLSADTSRGFALTSIKAQAVRQRLNDAFGIYNWTLTGEYQEAPDGMLYKGKLTVAIRDDEGKTIMSNSHEAVGFAKSGAKKLTGDLYKSAQTDCLSKAASNFGIGNEVFKGNVEPPKSKAAPKATTTNARGKSKWT